MPRPPSPARCPVVHWLVCVKEDKGLSPAARAHYLSVGRQALAEAHGAGVIHRGCVSAWLEVYRKLRERPADAITSGRLLAELTRCARTLGLLETLDRTGRRLSVRRRGSVFSAPGHPPVEPVEPDREDIGNREIDDAVDDGDVDVNQNDEPAG